MIFLCDFETDELIMKNSLSLIFLLSLVSGCAMTVVEEPIPEEMLIQGAELSRAPIPEKQALIEFTTNVSIPVAIAVANNDPKCSFRKLKPVGVAAKSFDPGKPESNSGLDGNRRYLKGVGNMKVAVRPIAPEKVYFYVDADEEVIISTRAQMSESNGYYSRSLSCGPLVTRFLPKAGQQYHLQFLGAGRDCSVLLQKAGSGNEADSVDNYSVWSCGGGKASSPITRPLNAGGR